MNKSILIIICDFLLLTLLAFVRIDDLDPSQPPPPVQNDTAADALKSPASSSQKDLVDVMKLSLDEERQLRERLASELAQTRETVKSQSDIVAEREKRLQEAQENLKSKDSEARRLEAERLALQSRFQATQSNIEKLRQELNATSAEAKVSKERSEAIQAELKARQQETLAMQSRLSDLEKTRELTEAEKKALTTQLVQSEAEKRFARELLDRSEMEKKLTREQLLAAENEKRATRDQLIAAETEKKLAREQLTAAETEKRSTRDQLVAAETEKKMAREQLDSVKGEVQVVRNEKAKLQEVASELAQGVIKMSEKSGELAKEIRENRPLAPNMIFNDFIANRVQTVFHAVRSGFLGREINRNRQSRTVLVSDGTRTYALFHISDTPLTFEEFGVDWDVLSASLSHGSSAGIQAGMLSFLEIDPRIIVVPVNAAQVRELGSKVYTLAKDPYKFQDAVLVAASEGYYGECRFQIDPQWPEFVRMDRSLFNKFVGKFNPSVGDLVFAKSGELLGIMVNKEYCALLNKFTPVANLKLGADAANQKSGSTLSQMYFRLGLLPGKLQ